MKQEEQHHTILRNTPFGRPYQSFRTLHAAVQDGSSAAPRLTVTLTGLQLDRQTEDAARAALARLLGLELDLSPFYRHAEDDPLLRALAARFRGLRPPRFPTLFECLVNAIACQQLTLTVGIRLLNRLAEAYGTAAGEGGVARLPAADPTRRAHRREAEAARLQRR